MSAHSTDETPRVKIVMLGFTYVGAKNLVRRLMGLEFDDNSPATMGGTFNKQALTVDGTSVMLEIWSLLHCPQHVASA